MNNCEKCNGFVQPEKHLDSSYNYIDVYRCINCGTYKYPNFKPTPPLIIGKCGGCGKQYFIPKLGRGRSKFCTRECNYLYNKNLKGGSNESRVENK